MQTIIAKTGLALAELTDDTALADIGIDSIMSIEIVSKATEASGFELAPSSLIEYGTIGELQRAFSTLQAIMTPLSCLEPDTALFKGESYDGPMYRLRSFDYCDDIESPVLDESEKGLQLTKLKVPPPKLSSAGHTIGGLLLIDMCALRLSSVQGDNEIGIAMFEAILARDDSGIWQGTDNTREHLQALFASVAAYNLLPLDG
ncbi:hypothetical protein LZ30DRAFT_692225 [Colletotrichum cereale]|nr:hypothetical protein LZ30DRAFT_692225 [Colletotrichum cereale]